MTEEKFWNQYEEAARQEMVTGRGGAIAFVKVETGWKGFATGASNDSTWFPAVRSNEKKWRVAKKAAQEVCDDGRFASSGINLRANKNKYYVQGAQRTYDEDRHFFRSDYFELTKNKDGDGVPKGHSVLIPALKAAGVVAGWEGWARLAWVPNPYYAALGDDEKARDKSITVITEVFADETAAMKAVGEMPTGDIGEGLGVPDGFSEEDWRTLEPELVEMLSGKDGVVSVAKEVGVESRYLEPLFIEANKDSLVEALKEHLDGGKSEAMAVTLVAKKAGIAARYLTPLAEGIVPV